MARNGRKMAINQSQILGNSLYVSSEQKSIRKQLVIQERGFYVSESAVSYLTLNTFTIFPSMYVVDFNTPFNYLGVPSHH